MTKKREANEPPRALRLVDVLRQLADKELDSLVERLRVRVDPAKRLDVPSQLARHLLTLPEVRDPQQLPGPTRELLYRIAESRGTLRVESLPPAVGPLVARGIVYARAGSEGIELFMPVAFMLQLKTWEGEDPRGLRALFSQLHQDVAASVASQHLGRPATPPLSLALESAWETLSDPDLLRAQVEELAPLERKLLRSIEEVGGEVDTEELLDLEREPLRLRGATGATPSRRGVGFALERRGFLLPIHPNRHVIPTEIAQVVGAQRRAEREAQRREIRLFVLGDDHAPRRARFADDPVPLALAMALSVRDPSMDVRPGIGTPKSLVTKFASRFGRETNAVALVAALSRAAGLWDPSSVGTQSPPGSHRVQDLYRVLFETWRRGGAWDEARADGEVLRAAGEAREASVVGIVREVVLEALQELGDGQWAPWEAIEAYVRADGRTPGIARLIERWAQRAGVPPLTPAEIAQRVAFESLHHLGLVDVGDPEEDQTTSLGPTLRITPRGRAFLTDAAPSSRMEASRFIDNQALRIGGAARVGDVLSVAAFVEVGGVSGGLDLIVTPQAMSLALSAGIEADVIRTRLETLSALPDPIARQLVQASAVIGRAEFLHTQGFLWVEDPEVRELLRTRRQSADLFVDPSPPAGLLVAPGVDLDRLARRCRALGVEVIVDGEVYRTRSMQPGGRGSGSRRLDSSGSNPSARRIDSSSSGSSPGSRPPASRRTTRGASSIPPPLKRNGY